MAPVRALVRASALVPAPSAIQAMLDSVMAIYSGLERALATWTARICPAVKRLAAHWVAATGHDVAMGPAEGELTPRKSFEDIAVITGATRVVTVVITVVILAVTIAVTAVTMSAILEEIPTTVSMGTLRAATILAPIAVATTILLTANPMFGGA